jgi:hypothetical protein
VENCFQRLSYAILHFCTIVINQTTLVSSYFDLYTYIYISIQSTKRERERERERERWPKEIGRGEREIVRMRGERESE